MVRMAESQIVAAEIIVPGTSKTKFVCELCSISFGLRGNLNKHMRKFHQLQIEIQANQECALCSEKFSSMNGLQQHIQNQHSIALKFNEETFYTEKDFQDWKKKIEDETHSSFLRRNTSISKFSGIITSYYKCHRSGVYKLKENRNRLVKAKGSIKFGKTCPAFMKVTTQIVDGISEIKVQIQSVHLGHELEKHTLTLRKEERENLTACLKLGIPMDKILDEAKQNFSPTNRYNLLTRKHLHNLRRTLGIQPDNNNPQNAGALQIADVEVSDSSMGGNECFDIAESDREEIDEHAKNTKIEIDHELQEHEKKAAVSSLLSLQQQNRESEEFSNRKRQIINQLKELQTRIEEWNPFCPLPEVEEHIKALNARLDISAGTSIPVIHLPETQPNFKQVNLPNNVKAKARKRTKNISKKNQPKIILN